MKLKEELDFEENFGLFFADELLSVKRGDEFPKICFVCTGNTCRSPMAEALFNHFNGDNPVKAVSAGIFASGAHISENSVRALIERGISPSPGNDFVNHIPKMIDEKIMSECDRIIAITQEHAMILMGRFPHHAMKIFSMPRDIPDPFGGGAEEYRKCLSDIEDGLAEMFPELDKGRGEETV